MKTPIKAAPWPFLVSEAAIKGPLLRELKVFQENNGFPTTAEDFDDVLGIKLLKDEEYQEEYITYNNVRALLKVARSYKARGLLGLLLVSTGANIENLLVDSFGVTTVGSLVASLDLPRLMLQFPDAHIDSVIRCASGALFDNDSFGHCGVQKWFENEPLRDERLEYFRDLGYSGFYAGDQIEQAHYITYCALARFCGKPLPHNSVQSLPSKVIDSLINLELTLEERREGLVAFSDQKIIRFNDEPMPVRWVVTSYLEKLVKVIAPLAILGGQDAIQVAERMKETFDFIFKRIEANQESYQMGDQKAYDASMRTVLMRVLWNKPECWDHFGLTNGDMLGVDVRHLLTKDIRWDTAVGDLSRYALIPRDGTDGAFGASALNKLGEQYDLFNAKHILRRWGTCNPAWVKKVKDFSTATEEINYLMSNDIWHLALQGGRLSGLFNETSAARAITEYLNKGGAANLARAKDAHVRLPEAIDTVLPLLSRRSQASRLPNVASLKPYQIELLPEKLHEIILGAELGL